METKEKATAAQTANNNKVDNQKGANNMRPNIPGKDKNDDTKNQATAQAAPASNATGAEAKTGGSPAQSQQPANPAKPAEAQAVAAPQSEQSKKEIKEQLADKQAHNLESTVKIVEQLSKRIAQKNKLFNTISNLDSFTIAQHDDKDDVASDSKFARCELVITDDAGNEFVTKNPYIIGLVVHDVKEVCLEKLAEVEASIVIP